MFDKNDFFDKDYEFTNSSSEEIWNVTYSNPDKSETNFNDTFFRVAKAIADNDFIRRTILTDNNNISKYNITEEYKKLLKTYIDNLFKNNQFIPGGRILSNAGLNYHGATLLNCFVSPSVEYDMDSIEGISKILKMQMLTLKSEGGWGFNASFIRPNGAYINGVGAQSPGVIGFLEIFDMSSDVITRGTSSLSIDDRAKKKIRKGAQMAILDIWHPDVCEFITAKQTFGVLQKFNISVNISDNFMDKLIKYKKAIENGMSEKDADELYNNWDLIFPDYDHSPECKEKYKKEWKGDINSWISQNLPVKIYKTVKCTDLWDLIMKSTYNRNEPGVVFLDRANEYNPANYAEWIVATNPCGEQTLSFANVCCVGSIDLTSFYDLDAKYFDFDKLKDTVRSAVDFLDNVIDLANPPLKEYKQSLIEKRRIAIGTMGFASLMYFMKIPFNSKESFDWIERIQKFIAVEAYKRSIELAKELGKFTVCDNKKHTEGKFIKQLNLPKEYLDSLMKFGIRNSALTSIQPTGNTSFVNNIKSSGCEPIFLQEYIRTISLGNNIPENIKPYLPPKYTDELVENEYFKFINEGDEKLLKAVIDGITYKIDLNRGLLKETLCEDYAVHVLKKRNEWDPTAPWAVTSMDISVEDHCESLKRFSKWLDSACSKTINIKNSYSFESFKDIYLNAYASQHIRGVTTYREGTMASVLSKIDSNDNTPFEEEKEIIINDPDLVKLKRILPADMITLEHKKNKWYLTITFKDEYKTKPFALFVTTKIKEHESQTYDAIDRLLQLSKNKGIPEEYIAKAFDTMDHESNSSKIAIMISLCLRHGILIKNIVGELNKIENVMVGTFLYHIKKFLSIYIKDGSKAEGVKCDNCNSENIIFIEGCFKCIDCNTSKCA